MDLKVRCFRHRAHENLKMEDLVSEKMKKHLVRNPVALAASLKCMMAALLLVPTCNPH